MEKKKKSGEATAPVVKEKRTKKSFTSLVNELDDSIQKQDKEFFLKREKIKEMGAELEKEKESAAKRNSEKAIELLQRLAIHKAKNLTSNVGVLEEIELIKDGGVDMARIYDLIEPEVKDVDYEEGDKSNG